MKLFLLILLASLLTQQLLLWRQKKRIQRTSDMLMKAAKELEWKEKQFQHERTLFVLGITQERELRQQRIEEAQRN